MAVRGQFSKFSDSATLTETLADVTTIPCANMERIWVHLVTSDDSAVDQFAIQAKVNADASAVNLFNAAADFTTPEGVLVGASGDLTALGANSTGWFVMDVRGIYQVILRAAQAAGDTTTLTIEIGGN